MDKYLKANQQLWNEWTEEHRKTPFYDIEGFKAVKVFTKEPYKAETEGTYATNFQGKKRTYYMWDHSLGEILNSLIDAGLRIEYLHEFQFALRAKFNNIIEREDGYRMFPPEFGMIPLLFSLKASRPKR